MKKTMWGQRLPALLLALVLCLSLLPAAALADDGDFTIENGVLIKYNGPGGAVVIPDGVTVIGESAFLSRTDITSVTIPDGVTEIGRSAFNYCRDMTNVTIPDSVTEIGWRAFYNCQNLVEVTIPRVVTRIGDEIFDYCTRLKSVTIPHGVTEIGSWAFGHTASLTSVTIPDSVTKIEDSFWGSGLTEITIPGSIRTIPTNAFYACDKLTKIEIQEGVTTIERDAFSMAKPTFVVFPASLASVNHPFDFRLDASYFYMGTMAQWAQVNVGSMPRSGTIPAKVMIMCSDGETKWYQRLADDPVCTTHTYNSGVVTKEPTLTTTGTKTYTCTVCGQTKTESIPRLTCTHSYDNGVVTRQPTATAEGVKTFTCTICGQTKTESIPKLGCTNHTYNSGVVTKQPTVTAEGVKTFTCTNCGQTRTESIPKLGCTNHTYNSGVVTKQPTVTAEGVKTFTCTNCGQTRTESIPKLDPPKSNFTDVPRWFATEVSWAEANGITEGYGNGKFGTNDPCTNAQILTFLWRAAEKPDAKAKSPFTVQSYYQGAVDWAYGEGMIDGSFDPKGSCTRSSAMVYIWRAFGKQSAPAGTFVDVPADASYAAAVNWGVANGVTEGFGNNDFQPGKVCSRGEIAAFLYRAYN